MPRVNHRLDSPGCSEYALREAQVLEEMKRLGWEEDDLPRRRKGDEGKVKIARRLRQETPVSLKWIAQRLRMGSWTYVSNLLPEKTYL
jgi:hypothetical protein